LIDRPLSQQSHRFRHCLFQLRTLYVK